MRFISNRYLHSICLFLFVVFLFAVCSGCTNRISLKSMGGIAIDNGFLESRFHGRYFDLLEYVHNGKPTGDGHVLNVYLEGDGRAWLNRRTPASDPTPDNPVSFLLAMQDPHALVAYLARPCQFVSGAERRNCISPLWTSARFSEPVVEETSRALDDLLRRTGANRLRLIGFSGGGALAVLMAARRADVVSLVTVAGNLDHAAWTSMHKVSPLVDSLNPMDVAQQVQHIEQLHIAGADDAVVPPSIARRFVEAMPDPVAARVVVIDGMGHHDGWSEATLLINP